MSELPQRDAGEVESPVEQPAELAADHSLRPRKPRTVGGLVYLVVLATHIVGLVLVVLGAWSAGLLTMGLALLAGALSRLVLPDDRAGMLGIRRKAVDLVTLTALGAALVTLALIVPEQGPL